MPIYDPIAASLAGSGLRRITPYQNQLPPDLENDLLRQIARSGLSTLHTVGHALDFAGRPVRRLLSGSDRDVSGRELLERWGILSPNRPGLDLGDVAGLAAEIVTDPLTYLTFGGSAMTNAGRALLKSGGIPKSAMGILGTRAGTRAQTIGQLLDQNIGPLVGGARQVGKGRMPEPVARQVYDAFSRNVGGVTDDILQQQVGGIARVGIPFTGAGVTLGTGSVGSRAILGALQKAGEGVRLNPLARTLAATFRAPTERIRTAEVQRISADLFDSKEWIRDMIGIDVGETVNFFKKNGLLADEAGDSRALGGLWRTLMEAYDSSSDGFRFVADMSPDTWPDAIQGIYTRMQREAPEQLAKMTQRVKWARGRLDDLMTRGTAAGANMKELTDQVVRYFPRMPSLVAGKRAAALFDPTDPHNLAREQIYKDIIGGTERLRDIIRRTHESFGTTEAMREAKPSGVAKRIQDLGLDRYFKVAQDAENVPKALRQRLLEFSRHIMRKTDDELAVGIYGNHPIMDFERRMVMGEQSIATTESLARGISELAATPDKVTGGIPGSVSVKELVQGLKGTNKRPKLNEETFLQNIADSMGTSVDELGDLRVSAQHAQDMRRLNETFTSPKAYEDLVKYFVDMPTQLFKAAVLNWPARFTRDFTSSQFMAFVTGNASPGDLVDAVKLARGGVIRGVKNKFPEVADEFVRRQKAGIIDKGETLSDAAGSDILREMAYGTRLVSGGGEYGAGALAGTEGVLAGTRSMGGLQTPSMQTMPPPAMIGEAPMPLRRILGGWIPPSLAEANPLATKGLPTTEGLRAMGQEAIGKTPPIASSDIPLRTESAFAPFRWGEELGTQVEQINRLVPFLNQLRKGATSFHARDVADAINVNYNWHRYTAAERNKLMRAFPFYKYMSRIIPFMVSELMTKPGGGLKQGIRGLTSGQDPDEFLPDYLSSEGAVPVGEGGALAGILGQSPDGYQRFISQFGLAPEYLNLLHTGPDAVTAGRRTGLDVLGMVNPLFKVPLEIATGRSFYQDRPLEDVEPATGRLLQQAGLLDDPKQFPVTLDQLLMGSPVSRGITSIRKLGDVRKGPVPRFLNFMTGMKISDIDIDSQKVYAAADKLRDILRGRPGVGTFESLYVERDGPISPEDRLLMQLYNGLQRRARRITAQRRAERARQSTQAE
jgi:hypothetical protein